MRLSWLLCAGCLLFHASGGPAQTPATAPELVRVEIAGAGPVVELLAGPGAVRYARSGGGRVYRSTNDGGSWSPLPLPSHPGLRVESLAVSLDALLLEGTWIEAHVSHGIVLRSADGGRTFMEANLPLQAATRAVIGAANGSATKTATKTATGAANRAATKTATRSATKSATGAANGAATEDVSSALGPRLASDPNHPATLLLATAQDGLWQTGNGGANWTRLRSFPALPLNGAGLTFVCIEPGGAGMGHESSTMVVGVADPFFNLLQSDDGGRSWVPVRGGPTGVFPNHAAVGADGVVFLSYGDTPGGRPGMTRGGVWRYTPRTRQWREITPAEAHGAGFGAVAVDSANRQHPQALYASAAGKEAAGLFTSHDGGAHWAALPPPSKQPARQVTALLAVSSDPSRTSAPERLLYAAGP